VTLEFILISVKYFLVIWWLWLVKNVFFVYIDICKRWIHFKFIWKWRNKIKIII